jgi:hypothetical protein
MIGRSNISNSVRIPVNSPMHKVGLPFAKRRGGWDVKKDTIFWAKERSGDTIPEENGNDIKILPAVFKGDGMCYLRNTSYRPFINDDWVLYLSFEINDVTIGNTTLFAQNNASVRLLLSVTNSRWEFVLTDGENNRDINIAFASLPVALKKYTFKIVHDKDGFTKIYESGIEVGSASGTFVNVADAGGLEFGSNAGNNKVSSKGFLIEAKIYSDIAETTMLSGWIFNGSQNAQYDYSGNAKSLETRYYSAGVNVGYSINGSRYMLDTGWTLWQHATNPDLIVPYGNTTNPIASAYSITKIYAGDVDGLNMADCMIGFNESQSDDSALTIFDRSDTDIFEDTARTGYYDSTNLATKSRFHISELYPYEKFRVMFKTAYKDIAFVKIEKDGSKFNLIEFFVNKKQATGSVLEKIKEYCNHDSSFTIGVNANFRIISRAINYSYDNYTLDIEAGTYNDYIDLTTKTLILSGSEIEDTIVHNILAAIDSVPTLSIGTNSILRNLILKKTTTNPPTRYVVEINDANCSLINVNINKAAGNNGTPLLVSGSSVVYMAGDIDSYNTGDCLIKETAKFTLVGDILRTHISIIDAAEVNIDVNEYWTTGNGAILGIDIQDNAGLTMIINESEKYTADGITEIVDGTFSSRSFELIDNASLDLSGNQITGSVIVNGNNNVLLHDIVNTFGKFWICTADGFTSADTVIELNNCNIYFDVNSDATGLHIIEDAAGCLVKIIDSILEFSGHNGNWFTMGNPIVSVGSLYIRNSEIIDNNNDNIPFGTNYASCIIGKEIFDIEDSIITTQNTDAVGDNQCLRIQKYAGGNINCRLKNVTFNNDSPTGSAIYSNFVEPFGAGDYICADNIINNSTGLIFDDSGGNGLTRYAELIAACPLEGF